MKKRVMITVGGTGGHLFPAQALAKQLENRLGKVEILFAGGGLAKNRFFDRNSFPHLEISSASPLWRKPFKLPGSIFHILKGMFQSWRIIKDFQPDVVVGFGSYHTFPLLLAAKALSKTVILHEANSYPGRVNRFFAKHVDRVCYHFPETKQWLNGKAEEVHLPLRDGYQPDPELREAAYHYYQLDPRRKTILVFGGSQGAKAINSIVMEAILQLSQEFHQIQFLHFTGDDQLSEKLRLFYPESGVKANVKDFEPRMEMAWQIADLMISRSGAMTIAEQMQMEVPGILIPYPYAMDNHQEHNANFMTKEVGGAIKFTEAQLTGKKLAKQIQMFLENDAQKLNEMKQQMREYKQQFQRRDLCSVVCEVLQEKL